MDSKIIPVKVALRCRPMVLKEKNEGCKNCLQIVPNVRQVIIDNNKAFTYDYVYSSIDEQQSVYEEAVKPLVDVFFKGYNATVLAYGQTGSGKTYTMGGASDMGPNVDENLSGVIPRVIRDIFCRVEQQSDKHSFTIKISYLELYREDILDLLAINRREKENQVTIRDDINGGIKLIGLSELEVKNVEDTMKHLVEGTQGRTVASTAMNQRSSRSHAIFTIHVDKISKTDENDVCKSKFHLVDLAGSERQKKTHAEGDRMKEGININMGLLALGNVISALGEEASKRSHIPYRDSKLTRLLQDSLGGNSHTLMVACISPADSNLEETISTLRYADRARKIKNKAVINRDPQMAEILRLRQMIAQLQEGVDLSTGHGNNRNHSDYMEQIKKLENENKKLTTSLQLVLEQNMEAEINKEKILNHLNELKQKTACLNLSMHDAEMQANQTNLLDLQKTILDIEFPCKENMLESVLEGNSQVNQEICNKHVFKQAELNKELSELNSMLQKKQELASQLLLSDEHMKELKQQYENQMKELESQIDVLQKEKDEILQNIRKDKNDSSLSEKRRKRVQILENEMSLLKKKVADQVKMISMKEQAAKQVEKLNQEILMMKQQKVKLVHQMKEESDNFRKLKADLAKEVIQLKSKDRKRQVEITRLERQHVNQQAMLKRKSEEATSANNRLKEVLLRQKAVLESRARKQESADASGIGQRIKKVMADEVELQTSIELARFCLEKQVASRAQLTQQVVAIKKKLDANHENSNTSSDTIDDDQQNLMATYNELNREIENCSSQITEFQQKLADVDQGDKSVSIYSQIHTMIEAKCAIKWMLDNLVSSKVLCEKVTSEQHEGQQQLEEATGQLNLLAEETKNIRLSYEQQLISLRQEQESKILFLLSQLKNTSNVGESDLMKRIQFQESEIQKLKRIEEELEIKTNQCEMLSKELMNQKYKTVLGVTGQLMPTDVSATDSSEDRNIFLNKEQKKRDVEYKVKRPSDEDEITDPTWHSGYTPALNKIKSKISQEANKTFSLNDESLEPRQLRKRSTKTDSDNSPDPNVPLDQEKKRRINRSKPSNDSL